MATCWSVSRRSWQINPISSQKKEGQSTSVRSSFLFVILLSKKQDFNASLLEGGGICVSK